MRYILACLYHPYFHVLTLGSLLTCCAVGFQSEETIEAAAQPVASRSRRDVDVSPLPEPEAVAAGDTLRPD